MFVIHLLRRCRTRYSLRTACIALTVLCVWLGVVTYRARQQQLATKQLHELQATVEYDCRPEDLRVPDWFRTWLGDDFFLSVVGVRLYDYRIDRKSQRRTPAQLDEAVEAMSRLPQLRSISFSNTQVRDEDLAWLAPLAGQIERLSFNGHNCKLSGQSLQLLDQLPALKTLSLSGTLDEEVFMSMARCARLESLTLSMCSFDGRWLSKLRSAVRLKSVLLANCQAAYTGSVPEGHYIFFRGSGVPGFIMNSSAVENPSPFPKKDQRSPPDLDEWTRQQLPSVEVHWLYVS